MSGKIAILGAGGQLGRALAQQLGDKAIAFARRDADLKNPRFVAALEGKDIAAVINAAAYTQVDQAEGAGKAEAMRVNAEAAGELALWCAAKNIPLVHFSTDYVFGGNGSEPQRENDPTKPINAYGQSKLLGEKAIALAGGKYLILRTSWVYDAKAKNFFTTINRLIRERDSLQVVDDQVGAPTYAPDLAKAALSALDKALGMPEFPTGIYHLCASGQTSWAGFAQAILSLAREADSGIRCQRIEPIPTSGYPLPAKRPLNSRLECAKALSTFGAQLPTWQEGLVACNREYKNAGAGL